MSSPETSTASAQEPSGNASAQPRLQPLGFVASVALIVVCLFGARATVTALGFTGFRMFEDGAVWWQVVVYFGIAVTYYTIGTLLVGLVRSRFAK